jgi:hypothetical protein
MAVDEHGTQHCEVGVGAKSHWQRDTNRYPGCTCPAWRYHPRYPKPTNPDCTTHGPSVSAPRSHV